MSHRDRWSSNAAFLLAAVGSAVGLGNVWRFPYLAYKHGGGAFLFPYLVTLFVFGIPLLIIETSLGQKLQQGAVGVFRKIHPRARGLGFLGIAASFIIVVYYAIVMAWSLYYFLQSFSAELPWQDSAKTYFYAEVLDLSEGIGVAGNMNWWLVACLAVVWSLIFLCIHEGVNSVGKVVMVTVPLPIFLLVVLFIRGITLEGAWNGISFYLTPDYSALFRAEVWIAAAGQIFFTLSLSMGVMIAYASFNKKTENVLRDGVIIALTNSLISIFAGFVVFSVIGYMASTTGQSVADVVASGPGLAFIVFPKALSLMPWASFFSALFFLTLLCLGVDSAFSLVESINVTIVDSYENLRKDRVAGAMCLICFLCGLIFTTDAGLYFLDVVDHYTSNVLLLVIGLLEVLVVGWVYGADKIRDFINHVSEQKIGAAWDLICKVVLPAILTVLLVTRLVEEWKAPYEGYPAWATGFGWMVVLIPLAIAAWMALVPDEGKKD